LSFEAETDRSLPKQSEFHRPIEEESSQEPTKSLEADRPTPEAVFDQFFPASAEPETYISLERAIDVAAKYPDLLASLNAMTPKKTVLRPQLPTTETNRKLSALEIGRLIQSKYPPAQLTSALRDIYNVIDINHNGFFTFEEYQQFLGQLL